MSDIASPTVLSKTDAACVSSIHRLSVIIITLNVESHIKACLESVRFADEIIVLDSGSTDATVAICKCYTALVYETDWPGFGVQKNRALAKATGDWVLSLDADEIVSPELATQIKMVIAQSQAMDGYKMRRLTSFCGRYIKHGDWSRDYCLRLFKNKHAKFTDVPIHEHIVVNGKVGHISGLLYHNSYDSLAVAITKMNTYSTIKAEMRHNNGKRFSLLHALLSAMWRFMRSYVLRLGFLDGLPGLLCALMSAEGSFYGYIKLMYLEKNAE